MRELRLLEADDAPALRALRLEALRQDPDAFLATVDEDAARDEAWFRQRLAEPDPGSGVMGGFVDGELVAMAGFVREQRRRARHKVRLWGIWVAPAARRQGVGRAVMEATLAHLREVGGVELVQLSVTTGQAAARALYTALGFQPFGLERRAIKHGDRYLDEEHLVCQLA